MTPEPDDIYRNPPARDPSLEEPPVQVHRVPAVIPSSRIHRAMGLMPSFLARPARLLLEDLLFPDQYPEWTLAALRKARSLPPVDAVWVTGGPFGIFVPAAIIARTLDRPLILDYRDPWSASVAPRRTVISVPRKALRLLEANILNRASGVAFVNEEMRRDNERVFGQKSGQVWSVIPNGFDPTDVIEAPPIVPIRPTLIYAGSCYGSRSMLPIIKVLKSDFGPGDHGLQVKIFGQLDPRAKAALQESPLQGRISVQDRIPAQELAGHLRGAHGLLLIIGEEHHSALSAKVFDYIQSERPIVGYGPVDCAAARLVKECGLGIWAHDTASLRQALERVASGTVPSNRRPEAIAQYSADVMAERTAKLLDRAVESHLESRP